MLNQVAQNLSKANYGPAPIDLLQFVFTSLESEVAKLKKWGKDFTTQS